MRNMYNIVLIFLAAAAWPAAAEPDDGERLKVFVSILPQAYIVERIGGERVQVEVLVRPGQSAETYQPTPRQMAALGQARLYLRIFDQDHYMGCGAEGECPTFLRCDGIATEVNAGGTCYAPVTIQVTNP